jgi:uncharacterized Tic20 family protein
MSLADELQKLEQLRQSGALNEQEYQLAKSAALAAAQRGGLPIQTWEFWSRPTVWAALMHLSVLAGYIIPFAGFVAPVVLWQSRKEDPFIDANGRIVVNAILSVLLWAAVSLLLVIFFVGVPMLYLLGVLMVALPLVGAFKAFQGKIWEYPLTFSFLRIGSEGSEKGS